MLKKLKFEFSSSLMFGFTIQKKSHNCCFSIKTILNDNKRPLNKTLFFNQRSIFNELFPEKQSGKLFL